MESSEAEKWPDLIAILRELVKPERDAQKREIRRRYWWRFGEPAPALYEALRHRKRCLAISIVSKHLMFSWSPTDRVYSHKAQVFPIEHERWLATLQSRVHEVWARLLSSTMRVDMNYSASDCFETFPFPPEPAFSTLDALGAKFDAERSVYMKANTVGLTTTYNRLKNAAVADPAIISLRRLHEEVDRAVLDAYGWTDVKVPPYCGATPAEFESFEDDVLDRLFDLNERRAREEALLAPASGKPKRRKAT